MTPKENLLRTIRHDRPEYVPFGVERWSGEILPSQVIMVVFPPIVARPQQAGLDDFGVAWSYEEGAEGGTYPTVGGQTINDISQWRSQLQLPDMDAMDWSMVRQQVEQFDRDKHLLQGFVEMGLFERSYLLLGMEQALMVYLTDTDEMAAMLDTLANFTIELIRRFHEEAGGLDLIWYGDDWGTQSGLFLPPDIWRRTIKPHTMRIYDCMKSLGILINQHSCGKIEAIFDDMVDMGADIWNPCQPCNDLAALKLHQAKRITFAGAIDSQFVLAKPGITLNEVRAEVRRRIIELAAGGGYIAGPSHGVPYSPEIINAMNDEIATFGRAFYAT